jgi:hypothetical protein
MSDDGARLWVAAAVGALFGLLIGVYTGQRADAHMRCWERAVRLAALTGDLFECRGYSGLYSPYCDSSARRLNEWRSTASLGQQQELLSNIVAWWGVPESYSFICDSELLGVEEQPGSRRVHDVDTPYNMNPNWNPDWLPRPRGPR